MVSMFSFENQSPVSYLNAFLEQTNTKEESVLLYYKRPLELYYTLHICMFPFRALCLQQDIYLYSDQIVAVFQVKGHISHRP